MPNALPGTENEVAIMGGGGGKGGGGIGAGDGLGGTEDWGFGGSGLGGTGDWGFGGSGLGKGREGNELQRARQAQAEDRVRARKAHLVILNPGVH